MKSTLFICLLAIFWLPTANAATFTVTNLNNSGAGSFRQALTSANGAPGADNIVFNISGTIPVIGALPGITGPISIDGTTAPGFVPCGPPTVALDGLGGGGNGLQFFSGASGSDISALNIRNFQFNAVQFIGTDDCQITGCYIGTNISGSAAASNGQNGIQIEGGGDNFRVGGSDPCDRNVISGNNGTGIAIIGGLNDTIAGNYIGVSADGLSAIGNSSNGIYLNSAISTVIGGLGANDGNVISDHPFVGIIIDAASNNTIVQGNLIGTNAAGTAAFGNQDSGILTINTSGITIGGNTPAHRNVISGSVTEYGVFLINSDNAVLQGNYIGTDNTGTVGLPNDSGGVNIDGGSTNVQIGGSGPGEGNVIAFNDGFGVRLVSGADVQGLISRNSMFCNTGKGIDLNGAGNANYPSPTFTSASTAGCTGTSQPNDIIELFYDANCTSTCQGRDYIATVTANGAGVWSYSGALNGNSTLVASARSVGPPVGSIDNTSEFECFSLLPVEGLEFSAQVTEVQSVQLRWSTLREVNSMRFDIEKSTDGNRFQKIGDLDAAGDDEDGQNYSFEDKEPGNGVVYYRLRQLDFNGAFEYSDIVEVELSQQEGFSVAIFPQPADEIVRLDFGQSAPSALHYEVLDLQGKILASQKLDGQTSPDFQIGVGSLANGLYFLVLRSENASVIKRLWVKH